MDNNMSAAAFIQRSGGSSSAASSTGTGSSTGGPGNASTAGGARMAVIGVTRNIRLRRRGASGFGFSLRGGREYAAGFYVSDVQPGGEAYRNGLRVGDQIIRVNGYPVEDAVHQEVALLAKNQQVLVLKVKSVGMIPVKDNPNDPLTWHMVQEQQQQQQQQLEIQYNDSNEAIPYNKVRIRVMVGEKGRLGCGVCRGTVPGLTVQGTREGGPARSAGLKAGDVIIWCNGQRLTDLPFERAIEVMRSAAILDLVVNRPIPQNNGLYDCPETLWMRGSSGYDSESSSIFTTSSTIPPPPPPHHNPSQNHFGTQLTRYYPRDDLCVDRNGRLCGALTMSTSSCTSSESSHPSDYHQSTNEWTRRPNNTTVIRVNHNINHLNQYHSNFQTNHGNFKLRSETEPLYDPVAKCCYESHDFDANPVEERNKRLVYEKNGLYDPPAATAAVAAADEHDSYNSKNNVEMDGQTVTTVQVHTSSGPLAAAPPPCPPPPMSFKWQSAEAKSMINMNKQMGSTMSMGSTGSTETESSLESCGGGKDSASTSSSLSTSSCDPTLTTLTSVSTANLPLGKLPELPQTFNRPASVVRPSITTDLGTAIAQELQRRVQQRNLNAVKAETIEEKSSRKLLKSQNVQDNKVAHDKLMEEFKRAHQKMFNQQKTDTASENKEQEKRILINSLTGGEDSSPPPSPPPPPPPPPPPIQLPLSVNSSVNHKEEMAVEMQSIESFKLKDSPNSVIPKPSATYFTVSSNNSSPTSTPSNASPYHSSLTTKSQINLKDSSSTSTTTLSSMEKNVQKSLNGQVAATAPGGKIAVKIGAYEGETRQPSRFDFLPFTKSGNDEISNNTPAVVSKLQNELVATLQRSNLRKMTGEDNAIASDKFQVSEAPKSNTLLKSKVEKLATALSNRVTIKVDSDGNESR